MRHDDQSGVLASIRLHYVYVSLDILHSCHGNHSGDERMASCLTVNIDIDLWIQ